MSAPNQVQSNVVSFYDDAYQQVSASFVAESFPANTFNSFLRWHRTGNKISLEIILNGIGVGVDTSIARFNSTTAVIPAEYRPNLPKYGCVMFSNSGAFNQAGFCLMQPDGFMYFYPSDGNFKAGTYIQNSTIFYYKA